MMSIGLMLDSVNGTGHSKLAFLEFGNEQPAHQQRFPGLSQTYPVHGLQPKGHSRKEGPFPGNYMLSLEYRYPRTVNAYSSFTYIVYQHSSGSVTHSRIERTGMWENFFKYIYICGQMFFYSGILKGLHSHMWPLQPAVKLWFCFIPVVSIS